MNGIASADAPTEEVGSATVMAFTLGISKERLMRLIVTRRLAATKRGDRWVTTTSELARVKLQLAGAK